MTFDLVSWCASNLHKPPLKQYWCLLNNSKHKFLAHHTKLQPFSDFVKSVQDAFKTEGGVKKQQKGAFVLSTHSLTAITPVIVPKIWKLLQLGVICKYIVESINHYCCTYMQCLWLEFSYISKYGWCHIKLKRWQVLLLASLVKCIGFSFIENIHLLLTETDGTNNFDTILILILLLALNRDRYWYRYFKVSI